MVEVAAEKNSTLVLPFPVEMLRFFEAAAQGGALPKPSATEAERERRSRIITAAGELQASAKLSQAAQAMSATPAALQLRLLQTMVEVAAEKNSTLVLPFPVEMLRFFEAAASGRVTLPTTDVAEPKPEQGREPVSEPLLRSNGHGA